MKETIVDQLQTERHEILRRAVDAFNHADLETYLQLYNPEIVFHGYTPLPMRLSEVRGYYDALFAAFPGLASTFDDEFWGEDRVVGRFMMRGRHQETYMSLPPTQRDIEVMTISIFRWEGTQVVERWSVSDTYGLLAQLGVNVPGV
jgi:predicted ester cyclase